MTSTPNPIVKGRQCRTGVVHFARYKRSPWGGYGLTETCRNASMNHAFLDEVPDETPVTCKRCAARIRR